MTEGRKRRLYQHLASRLVGRANCKQSGNTEWYDKHGDVISALVKRYMPSGSGFDCGTTLVEEESGENRLVFSTAYHHMNNAGMYDGWTEHKVIVTPSLTSGFSLRITGRDRNDIKSYIADTFGIALDEEVDDMQAMAA